MSTHNISYLPHKSAKYISPEGDFVELAERWQRFMLKAALLFGQKLHHRPLAAVSFSECDEELNLSVRVKCIETAVCRIEGKLDELLSIRISGDVPPPWFGASERRLMDSIGTIQADIRQVLDDHGNLRIENQRAKQDIGEMTEGADRFLAGLQQKLKKKERDLFFELIASKEINGARRVSTYAEIGIRLGITKQAVEKRLRALEKRNSQVTEYIKSIRHPIKTETFSAMSPSDRRKYGVDEAYNSKVR